MNPVRVPFAPVGAAVGARRAFRALPPASATATRASLPVVSNRAFISAWMARRRQLAAVAHVHRSN